MKRSVFGMVSLVMMLMGKGYSSRPQDEIEAPDRVCSKRFQTALQELKDIETLWSNDIMAVTARIRGFETNAVHDAFGSALFCSNYVRVVEGLQPANVPLPYVANDSGRCLRALNDALARSIERYPRNEEFLLMLQADFAGKILRERVRVAALIENEPQLLPLSRKRNAEGVLVTKFANRGDFEKWRARELRLGFLKNYLRILNSEDEYHLYGQFDEDAFGRQIQSLPEPRRTRLIDYIEKRIGRRMKWR